MKTIIIVIGLIAVAIVGYFALGMNASASGSSGGTSTSYDYTTNIIPPNSSSSGPTNTAIPVMTPRQVIGGANSNPRGYSLRGPTGTLIHGTNGNGINRNGTTFGTDAQGKSYLIFNKSQQG